MATKINVDVLNVKSQYEKSEIEKREINLKGKILTNVKSDHLLFVFLIYTFT